MWFRLSFWLICNWDYYFSCWIYFWSVLCCILRWNCCGCILLRSCTCSLYRVIGRISWIWITYRCILNLNSCCYICLILLYSWFYTCLRWIRSDYCYYWLLASILWAVIWLLCRCFICWIGTLCCLLNSILLCSVNFWLIICRNRILYCCTCILLRRCCILLLWRIFCLIICVIYCRCILWILLGCCI